MATHWFSRSWIAPRWHTWDMSSMMDRVLQAGFARLADHRIGGGVRGGGGGCHLMHVWVVVSKIFYVHPEDWGRWTQIWRAFFSNGLVQPPTRCVFVSFWSMQFLGWISCVFLGGWLWTVFTVSWSGWWFQICFYVHRYLWMMIQFDSYVQIRWNQRLLIFSHCFLMWQVTSFQWGIELPGENMVVWTCFNNPKDVI